jgi:hypothetical protein
MQRLIIDRFEGDYAVCETEEASFFNINKNILPPDAKEGSVIIINDDIITIDYDETKNRQERIKKKLENLFE